MTEDSFLAYHEESVRRHHHDSYNKEKFTFEWRTVDYVGVWAFGGTVKELAPVLLGVTYQVPQSDKTEGWWCYIGPTPEFTNTVGYLNRNEYLQQCKSGRELTTPFTTNLPLPRMES